MVVTAGQEYRVWFLEDLMASSYEHANNPEPSCMKVILSFSWNNWRRTEQKSILAVNDTKGIILQFKIIFLPMF